MAYYLVIYSMMTLAELMMIRAMCAILHMRNNKIYALVTLSSAIGFRALRDLLPADILSLWPVQLLHMALAVLFSIAFPIWYSTGPLRTRVVRTAFVSISYVLTDAFGGAIYSFLHGAYHPQGIEAGDIVSSLFVYGLILPLNALVLEGTIRYFTHGDRSASANLSLPSLALFAASQALYLFSMERSFAKNALTTSAGALGLLFMLLSIAIGYAMIYVTQRDVEATRAIADRAAAARQIKHLRYQVETTTLRSLHVRRLRHDLANQVDVVHELVAEGRPSDADRYLATLQEQARRLGGAS